MCRRSSYSLTVPVCFLAVLLALVLAYPGGIRAAYLDVQAYGSNQQMIDDEQAARERLSARSNAIGVRIQIKDGLIEELVAGRTSLAEVANQFEILNQDVRECRIVFQSRYPGMSPEQQAAQNVIDFVRAREMSACERADVLGRLRDEFRQMYGEQYAAAY